jgi:acyl carrier protein
MPTEASEPRRLICDAICQVAADLDPDQVASLADDVRLKDELELDSMDQLNIATAIFESCGVNIAERDYAHMETLGSFEDYLRDRLADSL